jgi:hypothetical protein
MVNKFPYESEVIIAACDSVALAKIGAVLQGFLFDNKRHVTLAYQ